MPLAAWFTLIISAVIILAIALALLRVILSLKAVSETLTTIIGGVQTIARQTSPVPEVIASVNANLKPVREWTETV